jgi:hypothetical protein
MVFTSIQCSENVAIMQIMVIITLYVSVSRCVFVCVSYIRQEKQMKMKEDTHYPLPLFIQGSVPLNVLLNLYAMCVYYIHTHCHLKKKKKTQLKNNVRTFISFTLFSPITDDWRAYIYNMQFMYRIQIYIHSYGYVYIHMCTFGAVLYCKCTRTYYI